jgi:hypothetical protein
MKMKRLAFLVAPIALGAACIEDPQPVDINGEWVAVRNASQTILTDADTFRFVFDQLGGEVHGTWEATGSKGTVVKPIALSGAVTGTDVYLSLVHDREINGCQGGASSCFALLYRLFGEVDGSGHLQARVIGGPGSLSGVPDSELPTLASWTLKRR